jgi:hypothetical protein
MERGGREGRERQGRGMGDEDRREETMSGQGGKAVIRRGMEMMQ